MPIIIAPQMVELKIIKIATDEKTRKRLESLGVLAGGDIKVISSSGGSVICKIKNGSLAIDNNVATKIFVR